MLVQQYLEPLTKWELTAVMMLTETDMLTAKMISSLMAHNGLTLTVMDTVMSQQETTLTCALLLLVCPIWTGLVVPILTLTDTLTQTQQAPTVLLGQN